MSFISGMVVLGNNAVNSLRQQWQLHQRIQVSNSSSCKGCYLWYEQRMLFCRTRLLKANTALSARCCILQIRKSRQRAAAYYKPGKAPCCAADTYITSRPQHLSFGIDDNAAKYSLHNRGFKLLFRTYRLVGLAVASAVASSPCGWLFFEELLPRQTANTTSQPSGQSRQFRCLPRIFRPSCKQAAYTGCELDRALAGHDSVHTIFQTP